MIDSIITAAQSELSLQLKSHYSLPPAKVKQIIDMAKDSILSQFKSEALRGNVSGIMNLYNGRDDIENSSIVQSIVYNFVRNIRSELGLSSELTNSISSFAIPFILNKINDHTLLSVLESGVDQEIIKDL